MWEVNEEQLEKLKGWIGEFGDEDLRKNIAECRGSPAVFECDKLMELLEPLSSDCPVYEFLESIRFHLPPVKKVVNPEYQARIERLKREQADREYKLMTRSVDVNQLYGREKIFQGFGAEMRAMNRQLVAVLNTVLTVAGGFFFGFYGLELAYQRAKLDLAVRMAAGLLIASVIFIADLYFIIRNMDDLGEKPIKGAKMTQVKKTVVIDGRTKGHKKTKVNKKID